MFRKKVIISDMKKINMADVISQVVKNENRQYNKDCKKCDTTDFISLRRKHLTTIKRLNNCYNIDTGKFVELVLKQINGEHAYVHNPIQNLTCTYGKLWLPVIDPKTGVVSNEEHSAIYYTSCDERFESLKKPTGYTVEEAKSTYEFALKQIYANKVVLLRENKDCIDVTPSKSPEQFSFKNIKYDCYPEYALEYGERNPKIIFGIMDICANKIVRENIEELGVNLYLVEHKPILKNLTKVLKKKGHDCHPALMENTNPKKEYKVAVVGTNNKVSYLKKAPKAITSKDSCDKER